METTHKHYNAKTIHDYFYHTVCNSTAFLDDISVNRRITKALVRTIEWFFAFNMQVSIFNWNPVLPDFTESVNFVQFIRLVNVFWPLTNATKKPNTTRTKSYFHCAKSGQGGLFLNAAINQKMQNKKVRVIGTLQCNWRQISLPFFVPMNFC